MVVYYELVSYRKFDPIHTQPTIERRKEEKALSNEYFFFGGTTREQHTHIK